MHIKSTLKDWEAYKEIQSISYYNFDLMIIIIILLLFLYFLNSYYYYYDDDDGYDEYLPIIIDYS
jgi:hypothetical protein